MEPRTFPDFSNTQEWNLVARGSYDVQRLTDKSYVPLPAQSWFINGSSVLIVGISSSTAAATWRTGGWARQILPFLPSTASQFVAAVQTERRWVQLGTLTLCVFSKLLPQWILELSFPYWLEQASVEIWRYDGADVSVFDRFNQVDAEINSIPN